MSAFSPSYAWACLAVREDIEPLWPVAYTYLQKQPLWMVFMNGLPFQPSQKKVSGCFRFGRVMSSVSLTRIGSPGSCKSGRTPGATCAGCRRGTGGLPHKDGTVLTTERPSKRAGHQRNQQTITKPTIQTNQTQTFGAVLQGDSHGSNTFACGSGSQIVRRKQGPTEAWWHGWWWCACVMYVPSPTACGFSANSISYLNRPPKGHIHRESVQGCQD